MYVLLINKMIVGISTGLIGIIFYSLTNNKPLSIHKYRYAAIGFSIFILHILTYYVADKYRPLIIVSLGILLFKLITKDKIINAIKGIAVAMLFMYTVETTYLLILFSIFNINLMELYNLNREISIVYIFILNLIKSVLAVFIYFKLNQLKKIVGGIILKHNKIELLMLYISIIIALSGNYLFMFYEYNYYVLTFRFLTLLSCSLYIFLLYISFKKESVLKVNYILETKAKHINNIKQLIDNLNITHHDLKNNLRAIQILCESEDIETLKTVRSIIGNLTNNLCYSSCSFETGDDYINTLLSLKYSEAQKNNIHFDVDFEHKLNSINYIPFEDIFNILANIIDNSIEALTEMNNPDIVKKITISAYIENDQYKISICNNGPMIPEKYMDKIFNSRFTTKQFEQELHGYGLYIAKQLTEKNNGSIFVFSSEKQTEFLVQFSLNKKTS